MKRVKTSLSLRLGSESLQMDLEGSMCHCHEKSEQQDQKPDLEAATSVRRPSRSNMSNVPLSILIVALR